MIRASFLRVVLLSAASSTWLCAMSLDPTCGERTSEAHPRAGPATTPRRILARLEFPVANDAKPTGLLAADLDGDGRDEIIVVTRGPGKLQILSGVTSALAPAPTPRVFAIDDFALGPVWLGGAKPAAKDAPLLAVFASRTKPGISVVDLRAAWKSAPGAELPIVWHIDLDRRPRVIASGDLGHDGKLEVAVITVDDDLVLVRGPNDVKKMHLGSDEGGDQLATCALFGADGKSIYVGFQGSRRLVRYEIASDKLVEKSATQLDGLPRALDEFTYVATLAPARLIYVVGGDHSLWTFNEDLGQYSDWVADAIPIAITHRELGGGETMYATLALQGQTAKVARSASSPSDAESLQSFYAGQHPLALALGDFDGDGQIDMAIANGDAKRVSVIFGDGKGGFEVAPNAKSGRQAHALAIGDLEGDKTPDVVELSALEGTISVLANHGGKLADHEVQGNSMSADALRLVDLDGDGFLDAAFLRRTDKSSVLTAFFGDGKGHLWERPEVMPVEVGASSGDLLIADLEGDGKLEAIVADPEGGKVVLVPIVRLARGSAHGPGVEFGTPHAIDVPTSPRALALLDAQGDAKLEIAVALGSPGKRLGVAILRTKKDASGALALEECGYVPLDEGALSIAAADFDKNGFTDLAVLVSKSDADSAFRVLSQAPDRTWTMSERTPTSLRPFALRAGDIDGDGRPDIVVSAQNSHHVNLWLNAGGNPLAWTRTADLGVGTGPLDIQLADLDGDGKLEIVVANAFSNDVSVIRFR